MLPLQRRQVLIRYPAIAPRHFQGRVGQQESDCSRANAARYPVFTRGYLAGDTAGRGMKTRTRIFAWFAVVFCVLFALVGISVVASKLFRHSSDGGGFFLALGAKGGGSFHAISAVLAASTMAFLLLAPPVGWVGLLKKRRWAWWLLVIAYAAWLSLTLRMADNVALWGWRAVVLALLLGLPLLVLLTDRPSGWTSGDVAEAPGDSRHRTVRAAKEPKKIQPTPEEKQARRVGPLTLIEWLVILVMLGILLAITLPAIHRARVAAPNAQRAVETHKPGEADHYFSPP